MAVAEERFDGIRLITGDLGGVALTTLGKVLSDVRLWMVGVKERSVDPVELDVDVLWNVDGEIIFKRSPGIWL